MWLGGRPMTDLTWRFPALLLGKAQLVPVDPPADAVPDPGVEVSLGASLRAAREASGRTVEQVSEWTRIRPTLIRDLEADRFESSGAAIYARGHLRAIATAIGVDPAPLVARFDDVTGRAPVVSEPASTTRPIQVGSTGSVFGAQAVTSTERRGPRWGVAVGGALGALVIVLAIAFVKGPAAKQPQSVEGLSGAVQPTATPGPRTAIRPTPPPPVDPGLTAKRPPTTGVQLRVRVIGGQSWVSVRNETGTLFEGVLHDGQYKDFSDASRLRVVVGNASAVNLNCGGRGSGAAGSSGAVRRFACTASGLAPA